MTTSRTKSTVAHAVAEIDRAGILLVFPVKNRPELPSLWSALHPRATMRWDWDEGADPRVVELWHLRERIASAREKPVAYAKWFAGRATFFSLPVFRALLGQLQPVDARGSLPPEARDILDLLLDNSPQSTKALRREAGLTGKPGERLFTRAMKALWSRLSIVGVGEVADGAFPSLAVAATETWFEEAWATRSSPSAADRAQLQGALERTPAFARQLARAAESTEDVGVGRRIDDD